MVTLVLASLLAVIFSYAGTVKLLQRHDVAETFAQLAPWLPAWIHQFAAAVPIAEITLGLALVMGIFPVLISLLALLLLFLFFLVILVALAMRTKVNCACFGSTSRHVVGGGTLARNSILLLMAAELSRRAVVSDWPSMPADGRWAVVLASVIALALIPLFAEVIAVGKHMRQVRVL